jgi:hypothetical protein
MSRQNTENFESEDPCNQGLNIPFSRLKEKVCDPEVPSFQKQDLLNVYIEFSQASFNQNAILSAFRIAAQSEHTWELAHALTPESLSIIKNLDLDESSKLKYRAEFLVKDLTLTCAFGKNIKFKDKISYAFSEIEKLYSECSALYVADKIDQDLFHQVAFTLCRSAMITNDPNYTPIISIVLYDLLEKLKVPYVDLNSELECLEIYPINKDSSLTTAILYRIAAMESLICSKQEQSIALNNIAIEVLKAINIADLKKGNPEFQNIASGTSGLKNLIAERIVLAHLDNLLIYCCLEDYQSANWELLQVIGYQQYETLETSGILYRYSKKLIAESVKHINFERAAEILSELANFYKLSRFFSAQQVFDFLLQVYEVYKFSDQQKGVRVSRDQERNTLQDYSDFAILQAYNYAADQKFSYSSNSVIKIENILYRELSVKYVLLSKNLDSDKIVHNLLSEFEAFAFSNENFQIKNELDNQSFSRIAATIMVAKVYDLLHDEQKVGADFSEQLQKLSLRSFRLLGGADGLAPELDKEILVKMHMDVAKLLIKHNEDYYSDGVVLYNRARELNERTDHQGQSIRETIIDIEIATTEFERGKFSKALDRTQQAYLKSEQSSERIDYRIMKALLNIQIESLQAMGQQAEANQLIIKLDKITPRD